MKEKNDEIGQRIKALRAKLGLSQDRFGSYIGTRSPSVHSWESGRTNPKRCTVLKIAKVFDVSLEWLDTGAGPMFAKDAEVPAPKPPESAGAGGRLDAETVARLFNALTDEEQAVVIEVITTELERKAAAARSKLDRLTNKG